MLIPTRLYLCSTLCIITNKTAYILNYSLSQRYHLTWEEHTHLHSKGSLRFELNIKCTQERHPPMFSRRLASKHLLTNIFSWQINGKRICILLRVETEVRAFQHPSLSYSSHTLYDLGQVRILCSWPILSELSSWRDWLGHLLLFQALTSFLKSKLMIEPSPQRSPSFSFPRLR